MEWTGIFAETQRQRDEEVARYLGIPLGEVERIEMPSKAGFPVHEGEDFAAESYCHLYERFGRDNPAEVLKMTAMYNVEKRKYLIEGLERIERALGPS